MNQSSGEDCSAECLVLRSAAGALCEVRNCCVDDEVTIDNII
jgi:hypothetical protein